MKRGRQVGISIVEIMVALTIGLFLTAGIIQLFYSSKQAYRADEGFSRLQENGRYALETLARDLRMHGNVGCNAMAQVEQGGTLQNAGGGAPTIWGTFNVVANDLLEGGTPIVGSALPIGYNADAADDTEKKLVNLDADVTWKADTDALVVAGVFGKGFYLGKDMSSWTSELELDTADSGFDKGDVLLITDCQNVDIFEVTNDAEGSATLQHDSSGNRNAQLSTVYKTDSPAFINAMVYPFSYRSYFIGTHKDDAAATPSLYVSTLDPVGVRATRQLVQNVEDMAVDYGIDSDNDGIVDRYVAAGGIGDDVTTPEVEADWDAVQSVRIQLLLRSPEAVAGDSQEVTFDGDTTTYTDRFQREVYGTTVAMRPRVEWRLKK